MSCNTIGVGYAPARLQLNLYCGMALNTVIEACADLPEDLTAELVIAYPQVDFYLSSSLTIAGSPSIIYIGLTDEQVSSIPRGSRAEIWFELPGSPPYVWRRGPVRFVEG